MFFACFTGFRRDFLDTYPFYRLAFRSGFDLLAWKGIYLGQFVFLEFFFRGFLLHACRPACVANAVFVMCVPYLMIHFAKRWPETTGPSCSVYSWACRPCAPARYGAARRCT